jgi:hypothetical protein
MWLTRVTTVSVGTAAEYWQMRYEERQAAFDYLDSLHHNLIIACTDAEEAFDNAIAIIEELAREHLELQDALHRELEAEIKEIYDDLDPDTVTVRPHKRHRPRRRANPTEDTTSAPASDSGASGAAWGPVCMIDEIPPEGFKEDVLGAILKRANAALDAHLRTGLAVCDWEIGRWRGIGEG